MTLLAVTAATAAATTTTEVKYIIVNNMKNKMEMNNIATLYDPYLLVTRSRASVTEMCPVPSHHTEDNSRLWMQCKKSTV